MAAGIWKALHFHSTNIMYMCNNAFDVHRWVGGVRKLSPAEVSSWAQHGQMVTKRLRCVGKEARPASLRS